MQFIDAQNLDLIIKLAIALTLGGVVGLERYFAGKPAGMRTYALVSMGSALFVIISQLVSAQYSLEGTASFDPLRMASQIIVGVGFLGAGMIVFQKERVTGLTSASGLWVAAAIGVAAGYGLHSLAIIATVLTLLIFTLFWFIEQQIRKIKNEVFDSEE